MLTSNSLYLLSLLRAILLGEETPPLPEDGNWLAVIRLALRHDVFLLVFDRIGQLDEVKALALYPEFHDQFVKRTMKCVNQSWEIEHLDDLMNSEHIPHLYLKGAFLRKVYPNPELREMCDIDLLIPPEREADALRLVRNDGYEMQEVLTTSHNTEHFKAPYQALELHTRLVPKDSPHSAYYEHIWERIEQGKNASSCNLTLEEHYIYLIVHMAKHYYTAGTGIRSVLDIAVFERAFGAQLDRAYLKKAFEELRLTEFSDDIALLAQNWFLAPAPVSLSAEQKRMHDAILLTSTYGTKERKNSLILKDEMASGKSQTWAKLHLFFAKIFPNYRFMVGWYPPLAKLPFLLPVIWVVRWFVLLAKEPQKLTQHYRWVRSVHLMDDDKEELAEKK